MSYSTNKANVIMMAAGLGSRMRPVTDTTPKPLVKVNEKRLIDTVIQAFPKDLVQNFYVVTGYLHEQFDVLLNDYENVKLIYNPDYNMTNNVSSVYYALDTLRLSDCFICESDLFITDGSFLSSTPDFSCYFGRYTDGYFDDWGFDLDDTGKIIRIKKGCENTFAMTGISYFDKENAKVLADCIEKAYSDIKMRNFFWDEIVDKNLDKLNLKIKEIKPGQITEIDTVDELEEVKRYFLLNKGDFNECMGKIMGK